jgi:AcrR family transcriptional regulator
MERLAFEMAKTAKSASKAARLTKGDRTREKILAAAENTFAQLGYERATSREVARAAGIHQPGIYNYFKTKRDLYEAVLNRMMHPLIGALDEISTLPAKDKSHPENKLVDMLLENRNIPSLLVRAFLSTNQTEKNLALIWVKQVMSHTPPRSQRLHRGSQKLGEVLKDMALFNAWLAYFWTAPIIEWLTGRKITDKALVKTQKELLVHIKATL